MKQNLQKRIIIPFIVFTIILTFSLISWSSILMTNYFKMKEFESLSNQLTSITTEFDTIQTTNQFMQSSTPSQEKTKELLTTYFTNEKINSLYSFNTFNKDLFQKEPKITFINSKSNQLETHYLFKRHLKSFSLEFNISNFIDSFTTINTIGVLFSTKEKSFTSIISNHPLNQKQKDSIYSQYHNLFQIVLSQYIIPLFSIPYF